MFGTTFSERDLASGRASGSHCMPEKYVRHAHHQKAPRSPLIVDWACKKSSINQSSSPSKTYRGGKRDPLAVLKVLRQDFFLVSCDASLRCLSLYWVIALTFNNIYIYIYIYIYTYMYKKILNKTKNRLTLTISNKQSLI